MKLTKFFLLSTGIALSILFQGANAQISISWPTHRQVFQRDGNNFATIPVMGQLYTCNTPIEYRVNIVDPKTDFISSYGSWSTLPSSQVSSSSGLFKIPFSLSVGWYRVEFKVGASPIYSTTFGVGDVYAIAGQSNAQGNPGTPLYSLNGYPGVVSININDNCKQTVSYPSPERLFQNNRVGPNGHNSWNWAVLGNKIVDTYGVPVAFYNAAAGGSTVQNWAESSNGTGTVASKTNSYYSGLQYCSGTFQPISTYPDSYYYGQPYLGLKNSLQFYCSMFGVRAVLWHQGEANTDKTPSITSSQYSNYLNTIINQSRSDYNSSLPWFVALASKTKLSGTTSTVITNNNVLSGQYDRAVANNNGPYTDNINVRSDLTHISGSGLYDLGQYWFSQITSLPPSVSTSTYTVNLYSLGNGSPTVSNQAGYLYVVGSQIYAPGGYSEYKWVYNENDISTSFSSSSSISPVNNYSYRCYMRNSSGHWVVSNKVSWPTQYNGCNGRKGVNENFEDKDPNFASGLYPNPVTDETKFHFTLKAESMVSLDIVDTQGRVISEVANNVHAAGTYSYPIRIEQNGTYLYRLTVNGLGVTGKFIKVQ